MTLRYEYEPGYCGELIASNGETVCTFTDEPNKDNARRIVACWNAFDGVLTEDVEAITGMDSFILKFNEYKAQRDELLDELKSIVNADQQWAQSRARAAIAKVKGEKS